MEAAELITFTGATIRQRCTSTEVNNIGIYIHFMDRIGFLEVVADLVLQALKMRFEVLLDVLLQVLEGHLLYRVQQDAVLDFDHIHLLIHPSLLLQDFPLLVH